MINSLLNFEPTNFVPKGRVLCDKIIFHKCEISVREVCYVPSVYSAFRAVYSMKLLTGTDHILANCFSTVGSLFVGIVLSCHRIKGSTTPGECSFKC
jgi:hypothetical protein